MSSRSSRGSDTRAARRPSGADDEKDSLEKDKKMENLQKDKQDLLEGNHSGFAKTMSELEKSRAARESQAESTKQLRLDYITIIYDAECKQISDEFEGEQRKLKDSMLKEIQSKITSLESPGIGLVSSGAGFGRKRGRSFEEEDDLRKRMIQANEKLMNLDYVMADEEIKSDIDTINKNLEKLKKTAKRQGDSANRRR